MCFIVPIIILLLVENSQQKLSKSKGSGSNETCTLQAEARKNYLEPSSGCYECQGSQGFPAAPNSGVQTRGNKKYGELVMRHLPATPSSSEASKNGVSLKAIKLYYKNTDYPLNLSSYTVMR